ncbi:hypothetical protein [Halosimplex salinum]|uniref:hypothetical protein n=1 Tax=Halosimplex salinum TaxID=1710538 RepID=UPI000F46A933|nr:hypothetical protein [Halosimplex salinum]
MSPRRRHVAALLLVVGLALLAGCGGPVPKQEVVCHGCVDAVENVTGGSGTAAVEESVTHVHLQPRGDARFVARMTVGGSGATNATTAERVVDRLEAIERSSHDPRPAFERRDLDARVSGDEVVVTYRVAAMTEPRFGATVSDRFYREDGEGRSDEVDYGPFRIGTDRLVVHGPDGTTPLVDVPGATVRGDRVVWTGDEISTRSYLVFGDGGGAVRGRAAVAANVLEWAGPEAAAASGIQVVLLAALATVFASTYPRRVADGWRPGDDDLFKALVLGLVVVPVGVVALGLSPIPSFLVAVLLPLGVGGWLVVRLGRWWTGDEDADGGGRDGDRSADSSAQFQTPTVRKPIGKRIADGEVVDRGVVLSVLASVAVVAAVTVLVAADFERVYVGTVVLAAAALPLVAFPVLGYLVTDRDRTAHRVVAVVAVAAGPWLLAFASTIDEGDSLDALFTLVLLPLGQFASGILLFYAALWVATPRRGSGTAE